MARRKAPRIPDALLDQLLPGADPKTAFDPNGLLDDLKKAFAERALNAEMRLATIAVAAVAALVA
jgi:putative transposase